MKKHLLLLLGSIMVSWALFATQINVLSEIFKSTSCPYCPSAQAGLQDLYNNQPNVIPLTWYTGSSIVSPNGSSRLSWYGSTGVPYARFSGTGVVSGGSSSGASMYPSYLTKYNAIINTSAPMEINVGMNFDNNGQLVVTADITMTANITETNNKVIIVLSNFADNGPKFLVTAYNEQAFPLNTTGQSGAYSATFPYDSNISLSNLKAVAFVQTWSASKKVFQAGMTGFSGMMATFSADILSGPGDLTVNFTDFSLPMDGITSWQWDFDNDGTIDSNEQNPTHTYTTPGNYTVSLTISDGTDSMTKTVQNMITVTNTDNISGLVQGTWKPEHGIYTLTGDVEVAVGKTLNIMPGTTIKAVDGKVIIVKGELLAMGNEDNFINFTSDTYWNGITVQNTEIPSVFLNCEFSKSIAGALKVTEAPVEVSGCRFLSNVGTVNAGAIDMQNADGSIIKGSYFARNTSTNNSGAIAVFGSQIDIKNNVFVNNTGKNAGALSAKTDSDVTLTNNTIVNNNNANNPGGQILTINSNVYIMNTIIKGHTPVFQQNGILDIQYSNVDGLPAGVGNIDADPMFVNPTTVVGFNGEPAYDGWYLQASSPCIDAGNPAVDFNDVENPSSVGTALFPAMGGLRNDMGAFGGNGSGSWVGNQDNPVFKPVSLNVKTYPNPFNPNVNISLNIQKAVNQPVNVELYNIRGQKIRSLFAGTATRNDLSLNWDGKDVNGNSMPTGVYFVKVNVGKDTVTKKIMMMK